MSHFSPKVSEILSFSKEEAERLASTSVGPEHLLLGILREKSGPVKEMMDTMNVNVESIKYELEQRIRQQDNGRLIFSSDLLLNEKALPLVRPKSAVLASSQ